MIDLDVIFDDTISLKTVVEHENEDKREVFMLICKLTTKIQNFTQKYKKQQNFIDAPKQETDESIEVLSFPHHITFCLNVDTEVSYNRANKNIIVAKEPVKEEVDINREVEEALEEYPLSSNVVFTCKDDICVYSRSNKLLKTRITIKSGSLEEDRISVYRLSDFIERREELIENIKEAYCLKSLGNTERYSEVCKEFNKLQQQTMVTKDKINSILELRNYLYDNCAIYEQFVSIRPEVNLSDVVLDYNFKNLLLNDMDIILFKQMSKIIQKQRELNQMVYILNDYMNNNFSKESINDWKHYSSHKIFN